MPKPTHFPPRWQGRFKFVGEIVAELKKVTWPSRREAVRLTMMVLAVAVTVGLALGAVDLAFTELAKKLFFPR